MTYLPFIEMSECRKYFIDFVSCEILKVLKTYKFFNISCLLCFFIFTFNAQLLGRDDENINF